VIGRADSGLDVVDQFWGHCGAIGCMLRIGWCSDIVELNAVRRIGMPVMEGNGYIKSLARI
jgi:hypothetical protein